MLNIDGKAFAKRDHYRALAEKILADPASHGNPKLLFEAARGIEEPKRRLNLLGKVVAKAPYDEHVLRMLVNTALTCSEFNTAFYYAERYRERYPALLEGHLLVAKVLEKRGDPDAAIARLRAEIRRFKEEPLYHFTLAMLAVQAHDADAARSYARRAHRLAPSSAMIKHLYERLDEIA